MTEASQPLEPATEPNAGNPAVPASINMPDHEVRQAKWYQVYVRLARPTLDWATIAWFCWGTMVQPIIAGKFDIVAVGMCLAWCAAVYSIKTYEKKQGVA